MEPSRRFFLTLAGAAPLVALAGSRAWAADVACYDPATLSLSQKNRRRGLGYVEASGDAKRRCGACAYFSAGQGGCGICQLLGGAPVNAGAVCASFAPKAA